jgi:putative ABC transport system permease protein
MTPGKLVVRSIVRRPGRFVFTLLGITIGIAAFVTFMSMGGSLRSEIDREANALGANLLVLPKGSCGYEQLSVLTGDQMPSTITSEEIAKLSAIEGLSVTPYLIQKTAINNEPVSVNGILPGEVKRTRGWEIAQGAYFTSPDQIGAVVGAAAAENFGLAAGGVVTLRGERIPVIGILEETGGKDDVTIFLPLSVAQSLFGAVDRVSYAAVNVADINRINTYTEQIRAAVGLGVVSDKQMLSSVLSIVGSVNVTLQLIAAVAVLAAAFGIVNTMLTATYERKREIGILQAMGARRRTIFSLFVLESGFYGVLGGACGVVLGLLASMVAAPYISDNAVTSFMHGSGSGIVFDPLVILGSIGLAAGVAVAAGAYPAYMAARLSPVEAISYE